MLGSFCAETARILPRMSLRADRQTVFDGDAAHLGDASARLFRLSAKPRISSMARRWPGRTPARNAHCLARPRRRPAHGLRDEAGKGDTGASRGRRGLGLHPPWREGEPPSSGDFTVSPRSDTQHLPSSASFRDLRGHGDCTSTKERRYADQGTADVGQSFEVAEQPEADWLAGDERAWGSSCPERRQNTVVTSSPHRPLVAVAAALLMRGRGRYRPRSRGPADYAAQASPCGSRTNFRTRCTSFRIPAPSFFERVDLGIDDIAGRGVACMSWRLYFSTGVRDSVWKD